MAGISDARLCCGHFFTLVLLDENSPHVQCHLDGLIARVVVDYHWQHVAAARKREQSPGQVISLVVARNYYRQYAALPPVSLSKLLACRICMLGNNGLSACPPNCSRSAYIGDMARPNGPYRVSGKAGYFVDFHSPLL
jgi:hypothetical protein